MLNFKSTSQSLKKMPKKWNKQNIHLHDIFIFNTLTIQIYFFFYLPLRCNLQTNNLYDSDSFFDPKCFSSNKYSFSGCENSQFFDISWIIITLSLCLPVQTINQNANKKKFNKKMFVSTLQGRVCKFTITPN